MSPGLFARLKRRRRKPPRPVHDHRHLTLTGIHYLLAFLLLAVGRKEDTVVVNAPYVTFHGAPVVALCLVLHAWRSARGKAWVVFLGFQTDVDEQRVTEIEQT